MKDNFLSKAPHNYKQVWQGHYTKEKYPNLLQSSFSDGTGCNILELHKISAVHCSGVRGKQCTIEEKTGKSVFSFLTVIYPFKGYLSSIGVTPADKIPNLNGWQINKLNFEANGKTLESISKNNISYLFGVEKIKINNVQISFTSKADIFVRTSRNTILLHALGYKKIVTNILGADSIFLDNHHIAGKVSLKPGEIIKCKE